MGDTKKGREENGEGKVVGQIKEKLDGSKVTALFPSVAKGSEESCLHISQAEQWLLIGRSPLPLPWSAALVVSAAVAICRITQQDIFL